MSLPMITFSFRPRSRSTLPEMAASVRTRVVSWKEAADSHEVVFSAALIRPSSTVCAVAGVAGGVDANLPHHLPDDHLDVLVVDVDTLASVHLLDLVHQEGLHGLF